jgi:phosphatidylglycerophosphate synthase
MLDRYSLQLLSPRLESIARLLAQKGVKADHITISGFFVGMAGAAAISLRYYFLGLLLILLNRLGDGLDGPLARMTGSTDRGAFLDITLDFIFYSAVVVGFALAEPANNALAATILIFSFIGTGSTFLAYAIMAERRSITNLKLPQKGFYYLGGIAEGTETILFLILFCLFPSLFSLFAWIFALLCMLATTIRIIYGYNSLR